MEPPTLFDEPLPELVQPERHEDRGRLTIQQTFELFDEANPWVREALTSMALELVHAGHERVGIGMIWEVVRWRTMRSTSDLASPFRLNNTLRSRYARSLMATVPELDGVFELRRVRTP